MLSRDTAMILTVESFENMFGKPSLHGLRETTINFSVVLASVEIKETWLSAIIDRFARDLKTYSDNQDVEVLSLEMVKNDKDESEVIIRVEVQTNIKP